MSSSKLPFPNPGACFWTNSTSELHDFRSSQALPEHSDIVIIGAGFAGVSTAFHLIQSDASSTGKAKSITILEARGVCTGATGRNGGHMRPDLYGHIPTFIDRAGVEKGAAIADFEVRNLKAVKKVVEDEKIDCDFRLCRTFDVWTTTETAAEAKKIYDLMVSMDLEFMNDVEFHLGDDVEGICGVKGATACASYTAATVWSYKLITQLLKIVLASGQVNLHTHTPATAMTPDRYPKGGFLITTPRGQIHASKVIHASNAYVSVLLPEYASSIIPCKGICCRIVPGEDVVAPLLNNSYIDRDNSGVCSYLIPRSDGSIVVGGAQSLFKPHREQWYNNVDDSVLIESAKGFYDDYMQRTFRGWEDSGSKVDQIWTGVMGYSYDSHPHIGAVPGKDGQYVLAGFNGHGMPVIFLGAKGLAAIIDEGVPFEEAGLPMLFKTTGERIERAEKLGEDEGDILGVGKFGPTKQ